MRKKLFITCASLLLLVAGCKTSKRGVQEELKEEFAYCEQLLTRDKESNTFSARSTISVDFAGKTLSSKASILIERDKAVQISVQPFLGIELFKVQVTTDTLLVIDRTQKRYLAVALSQLPIEVSPVVAQSLLLGEPFALGNDNLTAAQMVKEMTIEPTIQKGFEVKDSSDELFDLLFIGNAKANIELIHIDGKNKYQSNYSHWGYGGYDSDAKLGNIPSEIAAQSHLKGHSLSFTMKYSTPSWDKSSKISLAIPRGYKPMQLNDLTKLLSL